MAYGGFIMDAAAELGRNPVSGDLITRGMRAVAEEAPLGFAGDVDGTVSFRITRDAPRGFTVSRAERVPPPPPLEDESLIGGGVILTGMSAGRTLVTWRAQEELGLWLEERGLDDDLEGGGLHLALEGAVPERGAVGIFRTENMDDRGAESPFFEVCVYTNAGVIYRVTLLRPTAFPGNKIPSVFTAMGSERACDVLKLPRGGAIPSSGPCCWIKSELLVIGGNDGNVQCVSIVEGADGQVACLTEETLKEKGGWIPLYGGGGGNAKTVAISGFWQEQEKRAVILTLHTDWSLRVWTTTPTGSRRGGGLAQRMDVRQFLGATHQRQTAAMDEAGCYFSATAGQEESGQDKRFVIAAVAAEGGLPVHVVLELPNTGVGLSQRAILAAPNDTGPLVDACVDKDLAIWALWARPRGHAEGARGGITSYGRDGATLEAVDNIDIDQWSSVQHEEEDTVFDDLLRKHDWEGMIRLRSPDFASEVEGMRKYERRSRVACAAVDAIESFYLRRMFTSGRFGRRALCLALRDALPLLDAAGPLSSSSTSLEHLEALALKGIRQAAEQAYESLEEAGPIFESPVSAQTFQKALTTVHGQWKRLLEACVVWGRVEARPLGLAPDGRGEFGTPAVVRAGRVSCLFPLSNQSPPMTGSGAPTRERVSPRTEDVTRWRLEILRGIAAEVPGAIEKASAEMVDETVEPGAATAALRVFEAESALAREGTAGGVGDPNHPNSFAEGAGRYRRKQLSVLKKVVEDLIKTPLGIDLADRVAVAVRMDTIEDFLLWVKSMSTELVPERYYPLDFRRGVRGTSSGIATASAFCAIRVFRERCAEARNLAMVFLLMLQQTQRTGLVDQLEVYIKTQALPLALKCMNKYALAADVGSLRLRPRNDLEESSSLGEHPAMLEARKPWGCSVLEGMFLARRAMMQDYWQERAEEAGSRRHLIEGLGGLPTLLANMCEDISPPCWKDLDNGGLAAFLQGCRQYRLGLPLVGLAVAWRRLADKEDADAEVLMALGRGFVMSAEAVAHSGKRGSFEAACLLRKATSWFIKAEGSLEKSIRRGSMGGKAQSLVEHYEVCLRELEEMRGRVKKAAGVAKGGKDVLGESGALCALDLARLALSRDREMERAEGIRASELPPHQLAQQRARLCQLVFKHASEALKFDEAFNAICTNPEEQRREENIKALTQHMCESGRLGELCSLPLDEFPQNMTPSVIVTSTLWKLASGSNVAELVQEGAVRQGRPITNYFDCLYAFFTVRGMFVQAAEAQDEFRRRLQDHPAGSTLPFAAAAQRARLAALNALAVASSSGGDGSNGEGTAGLFPRRGDPGRRLDASGQPADIRTVSSLSRDAAVASAAIELAEARDPEGLEIFSGVPSMFSRRSSYNPAAVWNGCANGILWAQGSAVVLEGNMWRRRRRSRGEETTVITGVSKVVEALLGTGRYEQAVDIALRGFEHKPKAMYAAMDKIVITVTRACALAEDIAGGFSREGLPPLVRGVGPLKPRVSPEKATPASERTESLWLVLRQLLRLDSAACNFSYHAKAAKTLLEGMPACRLPSWLEDSFLGRGGALDAPSNANAFPQQRPRPLLAPWKAFASSRNAGNAGGANPTALLDLYVFDGRLEDACLFLSRLLDTDDTVTDVTSFTQLVSDRLQQPLLCLELETPTERGGTDWLPYASIDRLLALSEASLARKSLRGGVVANGGTVQDVQDDVSDGNKEGDFSHRDGLERALNTARARLVEYFKIAKALTDQAQARRRAQAAMGSSLSLAASFMVTD